jgi:hypothetical protein
VAVRFVQELINTFALAFDSGQPRADQTEVIAPVRFHSAKRKVEMDRFWSVRHHGALETLEIQLEDSFGAHNH